MAGKHHPESPDSLDMIGWRLLAALENILGFAPWRPQSSDTLCGLLVIPNLSAEAMKTLENASVSSFLVEI